MTGSSEFTWGFVDSCQQNCLQKNAGKTKELARPTLVNIRGTDPEPRVTIYKNLDIQLGALFRKIPGLNRVGGEQEDAR